MKTTSTTPVCGCEFERETHAVAHSHTPASLLERKPKSVRSSQLEFPLLQYYIFTWEGQIYRSIVNTMVQMVGCARQKCHAHTH